MKKKIIYFLLLLTISKGNFISASTIGNIINISDQTIAPSSLSSTMSLLQTTSKFASFFAQPDIQNIDTNGNLMIGYSKIGATIFPYMQTIENNITFLIDIYNQHAKSSRQQYLDKQEQIGLSMNDELSYLTQWVSSRNQFPINDLYNVYKSALTTPNGTTFIAPSAYTNTNLQNIKTLITDLANLAAKLSTTMYNLIIDDAYKITDPNDPLNAEILKAQVYQDASFILNITLTYIASLITTTPKTATVLFSPQESCNNNIAKSIMAAVNLAPGTASTSIIPSLLNGTAAGTIPTSPTTITISPLVIYAGVCAFINSYDANSTSGPYQPAITVLISLNNAIQSL